MNYVQIVGMPSGELKKNHILKKKGNKDEIVYETQVISETLSGKKNKVKILINENDKKINLLKDKGQIVSIIGNFHSFNKDEDNKRISEVYIRPNIIAKSVSFKNSNIVKLDGEIITDLLVKNTNSGLVVEARLRVKRENNIKKRYDYIPIVAYRSIAKDILKLKKYDKLFIKGRIHSRDYLKKNNNGESNMKTAYEVAIHEFSKIKSNKKES